MSRHVVAVTAALVIAASAFLSTAVQAQTRSKAAGLSKTYLLKATLDAKHEVPAPTDAKAAKGVFAANLKVAGKKSSFVWQLKFSGLSGRPTAAHVHYGAPGKAGVIALPLCIPCRPDASGAYRGPYVANASFLKAVLHGGAYVNAHTKRNPKGEIRGQIRVTAG